MLAISWTVVVITLGMARAGSVEDIMQGRGRGPGNGMNVDKLAGNRFSKFTLILPGINQLAS